MVKKTTKQQIKKIEPSFLNGLTIDQPSFVVDENGRMWWVDPTGQCIKAAKVE